MVLKTWNSPGIECELAWTGRRRGARGDYASPGRISPTLVALVERYRIEYEAMPDGRWRVSIGREICVRACGGSLEDTIQACLLAYLGAMSQLASLAA